MNSKSMTDFIKPTIITAQQYGTKVSVEIDHSDTSIDELFDAFQTICIGLGYHENSFKNWITERAEEYIETDAEELKEKLEAWKFEEDYTGQFEDWKNETPDDRYLATEQDEDEFDDYGARIVTDSSFEWGDEPEDDLEFPEPNEELKEGYKKYKKALKTLSAKQKKKSK